MKWTTGDCYPRFVAVMVVVQLYLFRCKEYEQVENKEMRKRETIIVLKVIVVIIICVVEN